MKDGPLTLGLHRKGSTYDVLETGDCALVHRDLDTVLACVLSFCRETGLPHFHKGNHQGYFRHLLVRCSAAMGEILIHLVTSSQADLDLTPLVQKLLALKLEGRIVGILHLINDSLADVVQSDRTELLWGRDWFYERLMGLTFKITSFSFFQPNSLAAELLYRRVLEYANQYIIRDNKKAPLVYDLYSGTGTITQLLASSVAREAVGVELVEEAVEAARENTLLNNLSNCHFIAGDVLKILDDLVEKPDIIVLDPPRDGIHPKALPKILSYQVDYIIYISCKASSLVRDLPAFFGAGYRLERACAVDQFCQTPHVETVCLLGRRKPDDTIKVSVNMDDYYQIRDAEEAEKNPS